VYRDSSICWRDRNAGNSFGRCYQHRAVVVFQLFYYLIIVNHFFFYEDFVLPAGVCEKPGRSRQGRCYCLTKCPAALTEKDRKY